MDVGLYAIKNTVVQFVNSFNQIPNRPNPSIQIAVKTIPFQLDPIPNSQVDVRIVVTT